LVPGARYLEGVNRLDSLPILVDRQPAELLVHDSLESCPYLDGETARMPLRLPVRPLTPAELDMRLAAGDRRHGALFYRPTCPSCSACQAIRVPVDDMKLGKTHRRTLNRGRRELRVELGPPRADQRRVTLYEMHRRGRNLARDASPAMDVLAYQRFLVDRYCNAFELRYYLGEELVGVAVTDRGERALSAVYTFYDPSLSKLSVGTYSILEQLELARRWGIRHLYLGLYIRGCDVMAYKARFYPHERRIDGTWTRFEKPTT